MKGKVITLRLDRKAGSGHRFNIKYRRMKKKVAEGENENTGMKSKENRM